MQVRFNVVMGAVFAMAAIGVLAGEDAALMLAFLASAERGIVRGIVR